MVRSVGLIVELETKLGIDAVTVTVQRCVEQRLHKCVGQDTESGRDGISPTDNRIHQTIGWHANVVFVNARRTNTADAAAGTVHYEAAEIVSFVFDALRHGGNDLFGQ